MRNFLVICFCFSSLSYSILSEATTLKTHSIIDANQLVSEGSSCWYDNKRYSEGALIQIHSFTLLCGSKNPQHSNSQLIWLKIDKQGNAIYPTTPKTITVN